VSSSSHEQEQYQGLSSQSAVIAVLSLSALAAEYGSMCQ